MACIARDDVEAACSKLRKMYCFIHKKTTPAFAEDGIEKIHPNGAGDPGGCSRKLLIHDVPPEVRRFFELYASWRAWLARLPEEADLLVRQACHGSACFIPISCRFFNHRAA